MNWKQLVLKKGKIMIVRDWVLSIEARINAITPNVPLGRVLGVAGVSRAAWWRWKNHANTDGPGMIKLSKVEQAVRTLEVQK